MRTDLSQEYLDAVEDGSRWRGHYLVFHWPNGDQYVADNDSVEYAPGLYCDALIKEWGTLTDSVDVEAAISGTGSQTRQFSVSMANTSDTGWWCSRFAEHPPENMTVDLFHIVDGVTPVLVGRFVMQSPIEDSEASDVVSITLLSANQKSDPFVGTLDPVTQKHYPLIIGAMAGVPGTPYGSHPLTKLDGDLAAGATTIKTDRPVSPAGFPTSGQLVIDYDVITYTGVNGVNFTGCSGVTKSHSSGQYVFKKNHEYLFAYGAGPVDFAGPVYVDGSPYAGQHTIYKSRNPVQVGFVDGYPFAVDDGLAEESVSLTDRTQLNIAGAGTVLVDIPGGWRLEAEDYTGYICTGILYAPEKTDFEVIKVRSSCCFTIEKDTHSYGDAEFRVNGYDCGSLSAKNGDVYRCFSTDKTSKVTAYWYAGFNIHQRTQSAFSGREIAAFIFKDSLTAIFTFRKIGWPKKVHFDSPSLNIGQSGAKANPSDLLASLLVKMGRTAYIDSVSFASCKSWFASNGYLMAGFMEGSKRCSEAVKDVCWQSRSYTVWDVDKVFLRIRFPLSSMPVSYASLPSNRKEGSIRRRRQDFTLGSSRLGATERQDGVVNALTVRYQQDIGGNFGARVDVVRQDSVDKIGRAEDIKDAYLVQGSAYAASLANFWVSETCWPQQILSFSATILDGLPLVQLGDAIALQTDWSGMGQFVGRVSSINRLLEQVEPEMRAQEWELTIAGLGDPLLRVVLQAFYNYRPVNNEASVNGLELVGPLKVEFYAVFVQIGEMAASLMSTISLYGRFLQQPALDLVGPLEAVLYAATMTYQSQDVEIQAVLGYGYSPKGSTPWGF